MLNLNDDMDDLLRQAADEYPLKINGKDWDKVLGGIESAAQNAPANKRQYWWFLLLLLPLIMAVPLFNKYNNSDAHKYASHPGTKTTDSTVAPQNLNTITDTNAAIHPKDKVTEQEMAANASAPQVKKAGGEIQEKALKSENPSIPNTAKSSTTSISEKNPASRTSGQSGKNMSISRNTTINSDKKTTAENAVTGKSEINATGNNGDANPLKNTTAAAQDSMKKAGDQDNLLVTATDSLHKNNATNIPVKDSAAATVKKATAKHVAPIKKKGLYAGLGTGLDFTTVKLNEINKLGYNVSFLVGYRFNNHWSVESALMWDEKNYYSPGEYFDKSRTNIPATSYIHYLNGTCRMFELPLNVKYDFSSKKLSGFYVSAGLSSYIMKKESYEYHATNNGNYYVSNREYKNSTNNIFSVANFSGGYQFIFKNNNSLRIEPYLKVPLNGLGIGKLPFSSAGISAAYTLPVH